MDKHQSYRSRYNFNQYIKEYHPNHVNYTWALNIINRNRYLDEYNRNYIHLPSVILLEEVISGSYIISRD